jgi:hypothetical protein
MATKTKKQYTLVRTLSAGVHFGVIKSRTGQEVVLTDARRIWAWSGANTLSEVALQGVSNSSRVSVPVPEITLLQAIELIPMSAAAVARFAAQGWGK